MRILAVEPYLGGSHQRFLDGLAERSRHDVAILGLRPRKWKWRMRAGAVQLAARLEELGSGFDLVLASDFLDLPAFRALTGGRLAGVPVAIYFHENQLTYPLPDEADRDYHYGFTDLLSILSADAALFNSRFHLDDFFRGARAMLARMPEDIRPLTLDKARNRSSVLHLGVDLAPFLAAADGKREKRSGPVRILWNHRWEWEKGPEEFFSILTQLSEKGLPFELVVCGQHSTHEPEVFARAGEQLARHVVFWGAAPERGDYVRLVAGCDLAVSCARQEFFGISVVEAMAAGLAVLLPDRLSYPELAKPLAGTRDHDFCLYPSTGELRRRLDWCLRHPEVVRQTSFTACVSRFDWPALIGRYDDTLSAIADGKYAKTGGNRD